MSKIARILVAVDGSDFSDTAFKRAAELSRVFGSKLTILTVVHLPVTLDPQTEHMHAIQGHMRVKAGELLSNLATAAKSQYGIEAETILAQGDPSGVIIDMAKEQDADLIVLGSRGLSGIKELFLGSVSHNVVRKAKQHVLVVR